MGRQWVATKRTQKVYRQQTRDRRSTAHIWPTYVVSAPALLDARGYHTVFSQQPSQTKAWQWNNNITHFRERTFTMSYYCTGNLIPRSACCASSGSRWLRRKNCFLSAGAILCSWFNASSAYIVYLHVCVWKLHSMTINHALDIILTSNACSAWKIPAKLKSLSVNTTNV